MSEEESKSNGLPTEEDFRQISTCPDAEYAWRNFGGLSIDKAYAKFVERPDIYHEEFAAMGGRAFAYYFPVIERYVRDSHVGPDDEYDEVDCMWILAHDIANRLRQPQIDYVRPLLARISALAVYVRGHLGQYCMMFDDQQRVDEAWAELQITLQEADRNG